ncbi:MAG: hypothetical protein U9O56_09440 [Campylobacterota bacterium]|nr:hypothetical protein [Campylobacterota bacterium]
MKYRLNKVVLFSLFAICLNGKNINYQSHYIHTLTTPKDDMTLSFAYLLLNDSVDILDIKESEFGQNDKYTSIGDLTGYDVRFTYGVSDNLMLSYNNSEQSIAYGNSNLTNNRNDIFLRYNFFNNSSDILNSGISIDLGYTKNKLFDKYFTNSNDIEELLKRYKYSNIDVPWVGVVNTSDSSIYSRVLSGFCINNTIVDFFIGLKSTKIKNYVVSTSTTNNMDLSRDELIYSIGFNITQDFQAYFIELGYEYDRFSRDEGLDYIDFNHIVDLTLGYNIDKNFMIYTSGKAMYRQFNGQIPYLYNKYTQTTYDHKYGYATLGIKYSY